MKKKLNIPFYVPLLLLFGIVVAIYYFQPRPVNWTPTWRNTDKNPFGTKALYRLLSDYVAPGELHSVRVLPKDIQRDTNQKAHYISIGNTIYGHTKYELEALHSFCKKGATVFLSSQSFTPSLCDTLGLSLSYNYENGSDINFTHKNVKAPLAYSLDPNETPLHFESYPQEAIVLTRNKAGFPTTISLPFANGNLILNTSPHLFSNYYLFKDNNVDYVEKTLSYLGEADVVYWDEYFKSSASSAQSPIQVLLQNKGFRFSWYLLMLLLALYLLFMSKRKQKEIPVIEPPLNASLEFTQTIGRLYYNQKRHHNLAQKQIQLFLEKIRMRYHISTEQIDEQFAEILAEKSGKEIEESKALVRTINEIQKASNMSEEDLQNFNKQLENFNKTIK